MQTSPTIAKIAKALLEAQKEMVNAVKDSKNPFFKSTYADLNSVREACMPALNKNNISAIQPTVSFEGRNYINTILMHESGEYLSGLTEIIYTKTNDAQAQGSGISYARRYGLQSMCNVGVADDDGNKASNPNPSGNTTAKPVEQVTPINVKSATATVQTNVGKGIGAVGSTTSSAMQPNTNFDKKELDPAKVKALEMFNALDKPTVLKYLIKDAKMKYISIEQFVEAEPIEKIREIYTKLTVK